ncbi:hypothetical protein HZA75_06420, partial [Candidatus Roizmanbacteria bacterium]|nr:hypothetical protein [Candidatus Roizmanbacteria bacterium]
MSPQILIVPTIVHNDVKLPEVYPQPNLVVLYTATILKNKGHNVIVRDMPVEGLSFKDYEEWAEEDD